MKRRSFRVRHIDQSTLSVFTTMLRLAVGFLIIAIIAAIFGFGGIAGTSAWIAKVLFVVFLILFAISFVFGRRATA